MIYTINRLFKHALLTMLCVLLIDNINAQATSAYDQKMADSLGGDDYGMKQYMFVILKIGTNKTATKAESDSAFRGHMENMGKLVKEKKLVVAGPFKKNEKSYSGIFILDVKTVEEAKIIVDNDPAVKAKLLEAEYYPWFGSAALPMYLQYQKQISKKSHRGD